MTEETNFTPAQPEQVVTPAEPAKPVYQFRFSPLFLIIDYLMRWALFGAWRFDLVAGWLFWTGQLAAVPLVVIILLLWRHSQVQKRYPDMDAAYMFSQATPSFLLSFLLSASLGSYVTYSLYPAWPFWLRVMSTTAAFLVYGAYVLVVLILGVRTQAQGETAGADEHTLTDEEWREENDLEIIKLDTDKISLAQRVEAYTLESALFGALGFSAFVTIVASEKPVLTGVQNLLRDVSDVSRLGLNFQFEQMAPVVADIVASHNLIAAIAIQTLISSMFFLSVIIARLRFNDVLRRVDYAIKIASSYNAKEEELLHLSLQDSVNDHGEIERRLHGLKTKISESIYYAGQQSTTGLVPIVKYMAVSRNLGVISFLSILITSALWVSHVMAVVFTAMCVLGYVYPSLDKWIRDRDLSKITFFQRGIKFFPHLPRQK